MKDILLQTANQNSVIHCGRGAFEKCLPALQQKKLFIVTDSNVFALYRDFIQKSFLNSPVFVIPAGEENKNKETLFRILDAMIEGNLTRSSTVIAFGGGVVGDITGLVASLYMRGVHLVQIPTTLLAQVDSSVGGKTAVDYGKVKNAIGTFYQPEEVIIDPLFLNTLPEREIRCGLGEIIKCGVLDEGIFLDLSDCPNLFDRQFLEEITHKCVELKAAIVHDDEHETNGKRKQLNVGHTTGHAFELFYGNRSHGEYVLIGLYYEMYLADRLGIIQPLYKEQFEKFIIGVIGKVPSFDNVEEAARLATHDKKNTAAGEISFIVPTQRGMFESVILPVDQYVRLIAECSEFLKTGKRPPVKLGLIGKDVSLSQSPEIHAFIAKHMGREITYEKVSIPEEQFESVMPKILHTFDGFNVTIPYKIAVIPYLKDTVGAAKALQTVNTVDLYGKGYSTDGAGFMLMLENEGVELKGKSVLLLGAGGASRAVALELLQGGAKVEVYSRTFSKVKELCDGLCGCTTDDNGVSGGKCHLPSVVALKELPLKSYDIIINVTGVGMHQSVGVSPVGKELIALCNIAVDLIYRPKKSRFLELAEECGKRIINGKAMLFYQAYISDLIYFNRYGWENNFADEAKELFEKYLKENGE